MKKGKWHYHEDKITKRIPFKGGHIFSYKCKLCGRERHNIVRRTVKHQ